MTLYVIIEAILGIIGGILLAACTKKAEGVTYGKLDKAGMILNVVLIPVYAITAPFYMFLGMISYPEYEGFLGMLGWIVAVIIASAALFSGLGLGASVALRKKGKSKQSFWVQFAGLAGAGVTVLFFLLFYGNLFASLN